MVVETKERDDEEATEEEEENIKDEAPIDKEEQKKIIQQIDREYQLGWELTQAKRAESLRRLKLYNNQKRDQSKVGDPLLFTVFNAVLARLYEDTLGVEFGGKEEGDEDVAENLNGLADHDHRIMEKDELDYEWDWDSGFFGRGLMLLNDFDRSLGAMCPVAEVVDPMCFLRDPKATSVNGNQKGFGALRFWGREIGLMMSQMKDHPSYFNLTGLKKDKDVKSLKKEAEQARREAQGLQVLDAKEEALDENYSYNLLEWWTHYKGKKIIVVLAEGRQKIVRFQYLKDNDGESLKQWPLLDRPIFPMAHDWDGVNIPDLIEDKQRARSVMINLGMESAIADLYPMYLFDKRKIKNTRDLKFAFNKFVPVAGDVTGAVAPIQKSLFHQQVNLILDILNTAAEKATAAPEVIQGVQPRKDRTLGETQEIVAGSGTRHSLSAKIFGWSEKRFWRQWYFLYKKHFKEEIDEKIIRIEGPLAPIWRALARDNIVARIDPDIIIESKSIADFNRRKKFQEFSAFAQIVIQDPETNRRYVNRKMGKIMGMKKQEMVLMFPPTIDEMRAEDENQQLNENKLPKIHPLDDDIIHIEIHNKALDKKSKLAHIEAHKLMMMKKKEKPEIFPAKERMMGFSPVSTPRTGAEQPALRGRGTSTVGREEEGQQQGAGV